jgi:hypothetical protein
LPNKPFAQPIRSLSFKTPGDCAMLCSLLGVQHASFALSLINGPDYRRALEAMAFCCYLYLLSVTIYDDSQDTDNDLSERRHMHRAAFSSLASHRSLCRLTTKSLLLPESWATANNSFSRAPFGSLRSLKMRITADTALDVLSLVPTVKELALDVIQFDPAGAVVGATAALLPGLRELKLKFWHPVVLTAERDLAALRLITKLQVLEIRNQGPFPQTPTSSVEAESFYAFLTSLPHLESLMLPPTLEVLALSDARIIGSLSIFGNCA